MHDMYSFHLGTNLGLKVSVNVLVLLYVSVCKSDLELVLTLVVTNPPGGATLLIFCCHDYYNRTNET